MTQKGFALTSLLILIALLITGVAFYYLKSLNKTSNYSSNSQSKNPTYNQPIPSGTYTPSNKDNVSLLVQKCGDIPSELDTKINKQHFDQIGGPFWSPDCKYIAWSKWISGTGGPGIEQQSESTYLNEGVFLYNPTTKEYKTIYQPKSNNETPTLINWKDSNTLIFNTNNIQYFYDPTTDSTK